VDKADVRKLGVVFRREYLERVRSKWFLVGTLLGPVFFAMITVVPILISSKTKASTDLANVTKRREHCWVGRYIAEPDKMLDEKEFLIAFADERRSTDLLRASRLERAIGVIYRPRTERQSHYFRARLADQFDAIIHIDETRAVEPLERTARWDEGEVPETFPSAV